VYQVYELANSDLESFIHENPISSRNPELSDSWLPQQLAGLAGAVQVVHNPEGSFKLAGGNTLGIPSPNAEKTGYIHDIKPENILVYKKRGGPYLLRLSDFSCARVAEFVATISGKRDSYKTGTKSGTPIYRAP
jgi:serine/threonine protein kinase